MGERKNKKNAILLIVLCVSIVVFTISLTYAYFVSQVGEKVEERITITNGTLALTFRDNDADIENIEGTWTLGDSVEKELVIENTGTLDTYAKISWENLVNTYLVESLTYTLEEKTDEAGSTWQRVETESENVPRSETASVQVLADHIFIPAGHTYSYRIRITFEDLPDIDQTSDIDATFITKFTLEESVSSLQELIETEKDGNPNFAIPAVTDETADGLYSMVDDYGISYYFRGAVENNYVKFGKNAAGQDMWWRIIRINGNGSIRMQYDGVGESGTSTYTRGFALTNQVWSNVYNDAKYIGWMYGGATGSASTSKEQAQRNETNSEIKTAVDAWYKSNLVDTGYSNYVHDAIFCNDRSIPGKSVTKWTRDTGLGYGQNVTGYGASGRFITGNNGTDLSAHPNPQPQFTCPQENDKFTVEETNGGNGNSTYPVGLITADEVVAAGSGKYMTTNSSYYLYKGSWYLSFSPSYFDGGSARVFNEKGNLGNYGVRASGAVAPVINIKPKYLNQLQGDGTLQNPYFLN